MVFTWRHYNNNKNDNNRIFQFFELRNAGQAIVYMFVLSVKFYKVISIYNSRAVRLVS